MDATDVYRLELASDITANISLSIPTDTPLGELNGSLLGTPGSPVFGTREDSLRGDFEGVGFFFPDGTGDTASQIVNLAAGTYLFEIEAGERLRTNGELLLRDEVVYELSILPI